MPSGVSLERRAPICNAGVENFVRDRHLSQHKRKVTQSRTTINNVWSAEEENKLQKAKRNVKRDHVQGERFASIEKENLRLLQKMNEIDQRGVAKAQVRTVLPPVKSAVSRCSSLPPCGAGSRSGARVRELQRIDAENQKFLSRLSGAKSSINLPKLDEAHRAQQAFMRMRCERPKPEWKELYPPMVIPVKLPEEEEPAIDVDCERLQRLQDQMRMRLEAEEHLEPSSPTDARQEKDADADGGIIGGDGEQTIEELEAELERFGGRIPASSQALVDELMAQDLKDKEQAAHLADQLKQKDDAEEDAAVAAYDAKEAAAKAFLAAEAVGYCGVDAGFMGYADVVRTRPNPLWD